MCYSLQVVCYYVLLSAGCVLLCVTVCYCVLLSAGCVLLCVTVCYCVLLSAGCVLLCVTVCYSLQVVCYCVLLSAGCVTLPPMVHSGTAHLNFYGRRDSVGSDIEHKSDVNIFV